MKLSPDTYLPHIWHEIDDLTLDLYKNGALDISGITRGSLTKIEPRHVYAIYMFLTKLPHVGVLLEEAEAERMRQSERKHRKSMRREWLNVHIRWPLRNWYRKSWIFWLRSKWRKYWLLRKITKIVNKHEAAMNQAGK